MTTGTRPPYYWYESRDDRLGLRDVLSAVPELVIGYHVAIVSFDGGPYFPSSHELADGWKQFGEVAISPRLKSPSVLPIAGYDEWYVLQSQRSFAVHGRPLNNTAFTLRDPAEAAAESMAALDQSAIEFQFQLLSKLQAAFWSSLGEASAVSFLGDGFPLIVATERLDLFDRVVALLPNERHVR